MLIEMVGPSGIGKSTLLTEAVEQEYQCLFSSEADRRGRIFMKNKYYNFSNASYYLEEKKDKDLAGFLRICMDVAYKCRVETMRVLQVMIMVSNTFKRYIDVRTLEKKGVTVIHDELFLHRACSMFPFVRGWKRYAKKYFKYVPLPDAVIICKAKAETIEERVRDRETGVNSYWGLNRDEILLVIKKMQEIDDMAAELLKKRGAKIFYLDMEGEKEIVQEGFAGIMSELGIEKALPIFYEKDDIKRVKAELVETSSNFKTREGHHTLKTEGAIYCSFKTSAITVKREEAQRSAKERLEKFGITKDNIKGKTVLDLGSNNGAMLFEVSNLRIAYGKGIEYDLEKVEIARKIASMSKLHMLEFEQGDIDLLTPERTGYYDVVFSLAIEKHVKNQKHLFRLLASVTRETLYFEGNSKCDIEAVGAELERLGFAQIEYLGFCDDDVRPENNVRPLLVARKQI